MFPNDELNVFVEQADENGFVAERDLASIAVEHDLDDDELAALRAELETRGVEIVPEEAELELSVDPSAAATTDALTMFMNQIGRYPLLSADEEKALARRVERGDQEAKERMINSNLRLVVSIARRYQNQELTLLDLIQEGTLGLIRAVEKFDWRKGFRFSTYATLWIQQAIQRALANQSRVIRLPVHVVEHQQRISRAERDLVTRLGREPTDAELAEAARLPEARVAQVRDLPRAVTSLDRPVGEEGDATLGDLMASEDPEPAADLEVSLQSELLERALSDLPERDARVLRWRYGSTAAAAHAAGCRPGARDHT